MFRRRRQTAARTSLFEPDFPCDAPGVAGVRVPYDPALWVRCPSTGQDRTDWHDRVLDAFAADLAWPERCFEREALDDALDKIADDLLPHTANFVMFDDKLEAPPATAHLDVADEELTLLEHGDPDTYLRFADVDPALDLKPRDFGQGWRWISHMGLEEGGLLIHVRAHKPLPTEPALHATGFGFCGQGKQSGLMIGLFARTRVLTNDGREL
jgi:hypothetical protein